MRIKLYDEKECLSCRVVLKAEFFGSYTNGTLKKYCRSCNNTIQYAYRDNKPREEVRECSSCHTLTANLSRARSTCNPCRKTQNAAAYQRKLAAAELVNPGAKERRNKKAKEARAKKRLVSDAKRDVRSRQLKMSEDLRTCTRCDESSHNFTGTKTTCRVCISSLNASYNAKKPKDGVGITQGVPKTHPAHNKTGRWGCFEVMADGSAVCDCGTKFVPTDLTFKFSRPCWHFAQQAANRLADRMICRD